MMARPLRLEFPGAWHHLMNRGANHQAIFYDSVDYLLFLSLLGECRTQWGLECHAYCLLPNHYHLLVHAPFGQLSRAMRHLDGLYTQKFNKAHGRDGPLMRGRFKSVLVDADNYLLQVARYIHLNPVKAALVEKPQDYPWSSYSAYLNPQRPAPYLVRDELLGLFASTIEEAVRSLRNFTLAGIDEETERFYARKKQGQVLGKVAFQKTQKGKIDNLQGRTSLLSRIPFMKEWPNPPSLSSIVSLIAQAYETHPKTLRLGKRGRSDEARRCLAYLGHVKAGYPLREIAVYLGDISHSAISNLCHRFENQLQSDEKIRERFSELEKVVAQA